MEENYNFHGYRSNFLQQHYQLDAGSNDKNHQSIVEMPLTFALNYFGRTYDYKSKYLAN